MPVVSNKELFRKLVYEIGVPIQLSREWVCVLSDDALTNTVDVPQIIQAIGIDIGSQHPTYPSYRIRKVSVTEGHGESPYHVHVMAEYGVILDNELLAPSSRAAVWEFDSAPGEVPAFYYYNDSGAKLPLTNSAYDYFPGLTTTESFVTVKVTKNFAALPDTWISAQNCVNDAPYLGCPIHSVKVEKVSVVQEAEEKAGLQKYWKATAELRYRQSGHNLLLPDIGFNFLDGNQKRRCMVFDFQNAEWIPSPNPVGLNGSGAQANGAPAILNRRVCPEADFLSLFGAPPTAPL